MNPAPTARPRLATTTGPAYANASARPAAAVRAEPDPDETGWFAGIHDNPVGPISRTELAKYVASGDVTAETLVWRDGFADWRPLRTVAALKEFMPTLRVVAPRPSVAPAVSFGENDGDATVVTEQGPGMLAAVLAQAAAATPVPPKTEQQLLDAPTRRLAALTDEQLRSINLSAPARPSGAPAAQRAAPAQSTPAPAPAPAAPTARATPVIGARPKAPAGAPPRAATGVAPAVRAPTMAPLGAGPRKLDPPSPTATNKPVASQPLRSTPPPSAKASAAPVVATPVVEAKVDVVAPPVATPAVSSPIVFDGPVGEKVPFVAPAVATTLGLQPTSPSAPPPGWNDPLFKPSIPPPAATPATSSTSAARAPVIAGWADPVFNSLAPPAPTPALTSTPPGANTGPVAFAVDVAHAKPRGIPKAAWFMALGVAVFGVMGGIAISRRQPTSRPVIVETPQTPGSREAQPDPHGGAAPSSRESRGESTGPDMVFTEGESGPSNPARRRHSSPSLQQAPAAPEASATARQAALERMIGGQLGSVPVLPATPLRTPSPSSTNNSAAGGGEQTSARTASNVPREREAADRLERSGVVRRCWEQFKLRNPAATPRRIEISVRVSETGAFTLRASGTGDESLSSCIQSRPVNALGPGAAAATTVHVTLN